MTEHQFPDDVRRMTDEINTHYVLTDTPSGWVAIRLDDGGSDHQLYDSRDAAIRHQGARSDDRLYLKLQPGGMGHKEAARLLAFSRKVAATPGYRLSDPTVMHKIPTRLEQLN